MYMKDEVLCEIVEVLHSFVGANVHVDSFVGYLVGKVAQDLGLV